MRGIPSKKVIAWRFLTGAHLDGRRRTNATWTRPGFRPREELNWWNKKPRIYRALYRWALLGCVAISLWLLIFHLFIFWSLVCVSTGVFVRTAWNSLRAQKVTLARTSTYSDPNREQIDEIVVPNVDNIVVDMTSRKAINDDG